MLSALRRRPVVLGVFLGIALVLGGRKLINETSVADWIISPLLTSDTIGPADVIVVPGAGVVGECGTNHTGVRRVLLAARLWREKRAPVVLITGGRPVGGCAIAVAMARLAADLGLPESALIVETASTSTRENADLSAPLLRARGVRRLLLVTDRLHMPRAEGAFRALGFDVQRASVPIFEGHDNNTDMLVAGLREYAALAYYRTRGWVGAGPPTSDQYATTPGSSDPDVEGSTGVTIPISYPEGPVVVLGASYAGGWKLPAAGRHPVLNKGVAGQQSFEMLERFERDVAGERPRAVVIWGFINDIFRAPGGRIEEVLPRIRDSYLSMVALSRKRGIEPILATEVTVRPADGFLETLAGWVGSIRGKESYQDRINRHVMETNRWVAGLAQREDLLLLDLQGALSEPGGRRRRQFTDADGSHITPAGYEALTTFARPILDRHFGSH